ncbi:MAG: hypothetical protein ABI903_16015 [Actinomycetota bacterium]
MTSTRKTSIVVGALFLTPIWLLAKGFNSSAQALTGKGDPLFAKTG